MEAVRIIKTITSDRLPELNNYKGKSVEIIILPDIKEKKDSLLIFSDLLTWIIHKCSKIKKIGFVYLVLTKKQA